MDPMGARSDKCNSFTKNESDKTNINTLEYTSQNCSNIIHKLFNREVSCN